MPDKIIFTLTPEQYQILIGELHSLYSYHWSDDGFHADNCGSKIVAEIEQQAQEQIKN